MTVYINDRKMTSAATRHTAYQQGSEGWTASWLPGRRLDRDQATTAMVLAYTVATNDLLCDRWLCPHTDQWAAERGLTGAHAVVKASEPPQST